MYRLFDLEVGRDGSEGGGRDGRAKISSPGPSRDLKLEAMSLDPLQIRSYGSWNIANSKTLKCLMNERRKERRRERVGDHGRGETRGGGHREMDAGRFQERRAGLAQNGL